MPEAFAQWLHRARTLRGLSGNVLAQKAGISQTTVSKYECNKLNPSRRNVRSLAAALGVDVNDGLVAAGFLPDARESATVLVSESGVEYSARSDTAALMKRIEALPPEGQELVEQTVDSLTKWVRGQEPSGE